MTTATRATLESKIDAFLKERRCSRGGGWAEVTSEDIENLDEIIELLVDLKSDRDADNDQTIQWSLVNRRVQEGCPFRAAPYSHDDIEDHLAAVELNFEIAFDRYQLARRLAKNHKQRLTK